MVFGLLDRWRRARSMRSSLASLQARVDALERTQGFGLASDKPVCPVVHIRDVPLETKEFWVKQINQARLTNLGRAALDAAFVGFANEYVGGEEGKRNYAELMSAHLDVRFELDPKVMRRWSGDRNLPRGR